MSKPRRWHRTRAARVHPMSDRQDLIALIEAAIGAHMEGRWDAFTRWLSLQKEIIAQEEERIARPKPLTDEQWEEGLREFETRRQELERTSHG